MKSKYETIKIHVKVREAHHQLSALAWISMPHGLWTCHGPAYSFLPPPFPPPQHLTASLILDSRKIMRMKPAASSSSESASEKDPQELEGTHLLSTQGRKVDKQELLPEKVGLGLRLALDTRIGLQLFLENYLKAPQDLPFASSQWIHIW